MIPHLHPHTGGCEHACCLKIEHLSVRIGGETILDNVDLHMHCGQMVALIGPNGAGKSTLIRAILGQREYTGKITFHEASGKEAKLRIGYVPQILDEPLSGVDVEGMSLLMDMLDEIRKKFDLSILMTTHDFTMLEQYCDQVVLLQGKILRRGTPLDVLNSEEFAQAFHMGGGPQA